MTSIDPFELETQPKNFLFLPSFRRFNWSDPPCCDKSLLCWTFSMRKNEKLIEFLVPFSRVSVTTFNSKIICSYSNLCFNTVLIPTTSCTLYSPRSTFVHSALHRNMFIFSYDLQVSRVVSFLQVSNANSVHISRVSICKKRPSHYDQYYYPNDIRCRMQTKKSLVMSSYPQSNFGDEREPFVNVCLITCSTVTKPQLRKKMQGDDTFQKHLNRGTKLCLS